MGKTKFNSKWQLNRPWLHPVKGDQYSACCAACQTVFSISGSGSSQVALHEGRSKHEMAMKDFKNQRSFEKASDGSLKLTSKGHIAFSEEEKVKNAEILQVLNIVQTNGSFRSANGDNKRFQRMFPDSKIAKSYEQQESKVKYVLQYGIVPYIKKVLFEEVNHQTFCFKFDESTTSQVKKQYDAYLTYYSSSQKEIVTSYCGSLFVGHCLAEDLIKHFYEFMSRCGLDVKKLLHIGMDGPSVNKKFERMLLQSLEKNESTTFICIGTCSLHIANNAFGEGMTTLREVINLDQFAIDLHFFFKNSSARRHDLKVISEITDVTVHYVLRHCQTRWLSIEKVLVRIIEQIDNLCEYFLKELPKQKSFKGKNGVGNTDRYKRIKDYLNNKSLLPFMAFVVFICQDFRRFLVPLQTKAPMIHLLYPMQRKLIQSLLKKFIKPDVFMRANGTDIIPNKKIVELDIYEKGNQLV